MIMVWIMIGLYNNMFFDDAQTEGLELQLAAGGRQKVI